MVDEERQQMEASHMVVFWPERRDISLQNLRAHCQHVILCHGGMPSEQNRVAKPGQGGVLNGLANFRVLDT